jgi:imidazole glycerol-phosphate synthase subunit HisH
MFFDLLKGFMIAIIDYGEGNITPVTDALKGITDDFVVTKREIDICKSDKIILPGLGEALFAMRQLNMANFSNLIRILKKPLLGIGLGAQILCEFSEEGNIPSIGIFPQRVVKLKAENLTVPHIGQSKISLSKESRLFEGIEDGEKFNFNHSYYISLSEFTTSKCLYGVEFASSFEKNNFYGVQFHPETSGEAGKKVLKNFIELC